MRTNYNKADWELHQQSLQKELKTITTPIKSPDDVKNASDTIIHTIQTASSQSVSQEKIILHTESCRLTLYNTLDTSVISQE